MKDEGKAWWQSRTIIGVAVMLLSQALRHANVDIVDAELTDMITLALDTLGAALAIYGRVNARKQLKLTMPGGAFNPRAEVRRGKRAGYINWPLILSLAAVACMWIGLSLFAVHWIATK